MSGHPHITYSAEGDSVVVDVTPYIYSDNPKTGRIDEVSIQNMTPKSVELHLQKFLFKVFKT